MLWFGSFPLELPHDLQLATRARASAGIKKLSGSERVAWRHGVNPLAIDLFCGLGGWTEGLQAEGYEVVGFDIEHHRYGDHAYPAQLVIQDVRTLHGSQFKDAALIVASPPCQEYSYRAMPWKRAKAMPPPDNTLFEACFRIQREACAASGCHIPLIVENVRGAQKWVGRARWNYGSFFLWGDVPALMPVTFKGVKVGGFSWSDYGKPGYKPQAFNGTAEKMMREASGQKLPGNNAPRMWSERRVQRLADGLRLTRTRFTAVVLAVKLEKQRVL